MFHSAHATSTPRPAASHREFLERLGELSPLEAPTDDAGGLRIDVGDLFLAVPMREIFAVAKASIDLVPDEIERLLESPIHEARVGAVSVMDFQARRSRTPEARRRELYELYLRRHDRINNWDLVDRAAPFVVGGYLADKSRAPLYVLARSSDAWERRTAIVATDYFIRLNDLDDTYALGQILADDPHDLVQKAVGGWLRHAGKRDRDRLRTFLDQHAATMARVTLRYAVEHLDKEERAHYLRLGRA